MSEDDTFAALCRTPLSVMRQKYNQWFRSAVVTTEARDIFFAEHGWTTKEFSRAHRESKIKLPHD